MAPEKGFVHYNPEYQGIHQNVFDIAAQSQDDRILPG